MSTEKVVVATIFVLDTRLVELHKGGTEANQTQGEDMANENEDKPVTKNDLLKSVVAGIEKSALESLKAVLKPKVLEINAAKATIKRVTQEVVALLEESGLDASQVKDLF